MHIINECLRILLKRRIRLWLGDPRIEKCRSCHSRHQNCSFLELRRFIERKHLVIELCMCCCMLLYQVQIQFAILDWLNKQRRGFRWKCCSGLKWYKSCRASRIRANFGQMIAVWLSRSLYLWFICSKSLFCLIIRKTANINCCYYLVYFKCQHFKWIKVPLFDSYAQ